MTRSPAKGQDSRNIDKRATSHEAFLEAAKQLAALVNQAIDRPKVWGKITLELNWSQGYLEGFRLHEDDSHKSQIITK